MEVILAKSAGFCFGVKRAVDMVYEKLEHNEGKPIYTYGPIIHNEEVVADLERKGVRVVEKLEDLEQLPGGIVINRSHGVSKEIYDRMLASGHEVVDATCPFVKRIHRIVEQESRTGKHIVIIGNPGHPEVEGIRGWSVSPVTILENPEEAQEVSLPENQETCIVSQTTFNYNKFQELVEIVKKRGYNGSVVNTICNATEERLLLWWVLPQGLPPQTILSRRFKIMSELTFEQMLDESFKTIHAGEVVEGTVIDVKPEEMVLNIGYKSDGILTRNEYTNEANVDLTTVAKVGDKMEVKILKVNDGEGQVILTYKRQSQEKKIYRRQKTSYRC